LQGKIAEEIGRAELGSRRIWGMPPAVIGQETIDRVRAHTAIVALVGETVKLQKRGRSHQGLCPFHKEKTPSSRERGARLLLRLRGPRRRLAS
jgi:hypothetical protein